MLKLYFKATYVTKDDEGVDPTYVFAIPVIAFSWQAENEKQLERFFPVNIFGDKEREKRLLHEMKVSIKRFD